MEVQTAIESERRGARVMGLIGVLLLVLWIAAYAQI